jgi:undecaprenyl-diphosphatase
VLARSAIRLPLGTRLDQRVELRVHGWVSGPVQALLESVSFFGSTIFILAASVVVAAVLWKMGARRRLRAFLLSMAGAAIWVQLLKQFFHRARPDLFDPLARALGYSFPSGHSALSAAFFGSIAGLAAASSKSRRQAARFLTLGVGMVFLVGVSRVALGVHWPTDVLAGWSVGFGWLALIFAVAEHQARLARVPPAPS